MKISALGCFVPPGVLTKKDLERMVDTNSEWIVERTGICERHIAAPDMATSDMGTEAARIALASTAASPATNWTPLSFAPSPPTCSFPPPRA